MFQRCVETTLESAQNKTKLNLVDFPNKNNDNHWIFTLPNLLRTKHKVLFFQTNAAKNITTFNPNPSNKPRNPAGNRGGGGLPRLFFRRPTFNFGSGSDGIHLKDPGQVVLGCGCALMTGLEVPHERSSFWVFPKMVAPPFKTPKCWSFLVGKPIVVGYHRFRKPLFSIMIVGKMAIFCS